MLEKVISEMTKDIMTAIEYVFNQQGINPKVGINTLNDSNLLKNVQVKCTNDGNLLMSMAFDEYITYIENGRRKGAKFPPPQPIIKWARSRGIPTDNSTIFLIRRAISRDGIRPRPLIERIFGAIDNHWEHGWSDKIFDEITKILDEYFK